MTGGHNERVQEPAVGVSADRPRMSGPLKSLMDSLKGEGCALNSLLNTVEPDARMALHDPGFANAEQLLRWLSRIHAPASLGLGSVLLDVAHFQDWPGVRKRVADEGWPISMQYDMATEDFHRITDLVILCKYCHTLFDEKLISKYIVQAAQRHMWAMPAAEPALRKFIATSLSHHSGHQPDSTNVVLAVSLLYEHHGVREPFVVSARPRSRGMNYIVFPEHQRIACRFTGDDTEG